MTRAVKCPVCQKASKIEDSDYYIETGEVVVVWVPQPLYQFSYPDNPDYISPRCDKCMRKRGH